MLSVCCIIRFRREKGMIDFLAESTWEILRTHPSRISPWLTIWRPCVRSETWGWAEGSPAGKLYLRTELISTRSYLETEDSVTQTGSVPKPRQPIHPPLSQYYTWKNVKVFFFFFPKTSIAQIHQDDKVQALEKVHCSISLLLRCSCHSLRKGKYFPEVTNLLLSTFSYLLIIRKCGLTSFNLSCPSQVKLTQWPHFGKLQWKRVNCSTLFPI